MSRAPTKASPRATSAAISAAERRCSVSATAGLGAVGAGAGGSTDGAAAAAEGELVNCVSTGPGAGVIVVGCGCGGAASSVDEASAATLLGVSTAPNDAGGSLSSPARCSEIGGTRAGGVSCATAAGGAIASA